MAHLKIGNDKALENCGKKSKNDPFIEMGLEFKDEISKVNTYDEKIINRISLRLNILINDLFMFCFLTRSMIILFIGSLFWPILYQTDFLNY